MPNGEGWVVSGALRTGGTDAESFQVVTAQVADSAITAAKLAAGAASAGVYGLAWSTYGNVTYG